MATRRADVLQVVLCFAVLLGGSQAATIRADCTININGGLPDPQPLILKNGGSNDVYGFHLPSSGGIVTLAEGTVIRLVCSGSSNYFTALGTSTRDVQATCVGGTTFTVSGTSYDFPLLNCNANCVHVAQRSGGSCFGGGSLVDIGFEVGTSLFRTVEVCFDDANLNAVWSKLELPSNIGGYQVGFPRPSSFAAGGFFPGLNPDTQYTRATQRDSVAEILGSTALADQYISQTTDYFMSRGHLTANADFIYGAQMRSTFYFINVAPQWQTFNGANWQVIEDNTRDLASNRGLDLQVYTGGHGVTWLPDINGQRAKLYLYKDSNNNYQIPVPAVFWKVVYDPVSRRGAALIGVNNPHIDFADLGIEERFCTDVCSQLSWVTWSALDQKKGYAFCCDVNDFRSSVPSLPSFTVSGLLT